MRSSTTRVSVMADSSVGALWVGLAVLMRGPFHKSDVKHNKCTLCQMEGLGWLESAMAALEDYLGD